MGRWYTLKKKNQTTKGKYRSPINTLRCPAPYASANNSTEHSVCLSWSEFKKEKCVIDGMDKLKHTRPGRTRMEVIFEPFKEKENFVL